MLHTLANPSAVKLFSSEKEIVKLKTNNDASIDWIIYFLRSDIILHK
jgi:hypothetical protein